MSVTKPTNETWLSAYQETLYGITAENGFPFFYSSVTNVGGKAQFNAGIVPYGVAPGKRLYQPTGAYAGLHVIVSVDGSNNILTNTDYISNDSSVTSTILTNHIFRIHYGSPSIDQGPMEVRPVWVGENLIVDIQQFLQSMFTIQPPVEGPDVNMYKHIQIQPYPAEDYLQFLVDNSLDPETIMEDRTGYDWDNFVWYVCNGVLPHTILNSDHVGGTTVLAENPPIIFTGYPSLFSRIVGTEIINYYL
jgi:hypothetical protein